MRAGGKSHASRGHFQSALAGVVEGAILAKQVRGNVRVVIAAGLLDDSRSHHPLADLGRGNAVVLAAQLLVGYPRNFDMDVDAVQQRSSNLTQVALNDARRTAALARSVAVESTRAPVQIATGL